MGSHHNVDALDVGRLLDEAFTALNQVIRDGLSSSLYSLHVPRIHVQQHQASRPFVCGHTGDDSRGLDEAEVKRSDRKCGFRSLERHPLVRILRTSSSDTLSAPRLWWQMSELVNFFLRVRRFTVVRDWDRSFSTASFWTNFVPCLGNDSSSKRRSSNLNGD